MIPNNLPKGTKIRIIDPGEGPLADTQFRVNPIVTVDYYSDDYVHIEEWPGGVGFFLRRFEVADMLQIQSTDTLLLL